MTALTRCCWRSGGRWSREAAMHPRRTKCTRRGQVPRRPNDPRKTDVSASGKCSALLPKNALGAETTRTRRESTPYAAVLFRQARILTTPIECLAAHLARNCMDAIARREHHAPRARAAPHRAARRLFRRLSRARHLPVRRVPPYRARSAREDTLTLTALPPLKTNTLWLSQVPKASRMSLLRGTPQRAIP